MHINERSVGLLREATIDKVNALCHVGTRILLVFSLAQQVKK
jgi:hypothetical protein